MTMRLNPDVLYQIKLDVAKRMLLAAMVFRATLRDNISTPYPPASQPGEYPHLRTGTGYKEIFVIPDTPEGIVDDGLNVWVGFSNLAWYMPFLERERDRLGIFYLFNEMQPRLRAIMAGEGL